MYNEELKNRFLSEYSDSENTIRRIKNTFEMLAPYEEQWGADICTKSGEDLRVAFENTLGIRASNRTVVLSTLKQYINWCVANEVHGANAEFIDTKDVGTGKILEHMVKSPEHLQSCLNAIFPPAEEKMFDNIFRCFMWLAFSGINENDCIHITRDHIVPWDRAIIYNDVSYPIYKESIPVFDHLCRAKSLKCDFVRYQKIHDRVPGSQLLRGVKGESGVDLEVLVHNCSRKIRIARKTMPACIQLRYRNVWLSGVFYRALEVERRGEEPDFASVIKNQYLGRQVPSNNRMKQLVYEYRTDYQRWKTAFEL